MMRDNHGRLYNWVAVSLLALLLVIVVPPKARAQDRATPEAHELAGLILSSGMFDALMAQAGLTAAAPIITVIEGHLRRSLSDDERSQLRSIVTQVMKDTLPWAAWEGLYAHLYSKHASPTEITELLAFYKTPLGRRALSLGVILAIQGGDAGRTLGKSHENEFRNRFMDAFGKTMPALKAELERSGPAR